MSKNNKQLALAMIVKPSEAESDVLYRALTTESLHLNVDKVFITITCKEGDPKSEPVRKVAERAGAEISYFEWVDDFAKARNFNFNQVPEEYDFIMWADADDIVRGAADLKNMLTEMDDSFAAVVLPYLYDFDEHGECTVRHNKTRIIRNDGSFKWKGRLHEDLIPQHTVNTYFCKDIKVLHLTNHERVEEAIRRNVRITGKALKEDDEEPRNHWNHANALYMAGDFRQAIETFFDFIPLSRAEEEKFMAWDRIARIYYQMNDYERSIESGLEALRIRPWYPHAYFTLAQSFFNVEKFKHAKVLLLDGLKKEVPEMDMIVWNPRDFDYNPLSLLAKCYLQLGKPKKSYKIIKKLQKMFPKRKNLKKLGKQLQAKVKDLDKVEKITKKVKKCETKKEIKKELDKVPKDLQSHPAITHLRNIHFIKKESSGKDLVFYCFETAETWNPDSIEEGGVGGSEEAVINLAPRLSDLGWNVTVYNSCGHEAKKYGDVWWRPFWEYNYRDKQDVVIAWRKPTTFEYNVNTDKGYIDMHDVVSPQEFTKKRLDHIDKILVKSKFQRELLPNIPDEKFAVIGHGIDQSYFDKEVKRNPYKMVYTSSYDRGLVHLLRRWDKVKEAVPQAELHIFYGWQLFDSVYAEDNAHQDWKQKMVKWMKQDGVHEHGRVSHPKIAKEMLSAGIFAYPCHFEEIFCISAGKAQLAGAVPVTTDYGSLNEVVQYGAKCPSRDGMVSNNNLKKENKEEKKFWDNYTDELIKMLKDHERQEKIREKMMPWAKKEFSWDKTAKAWDKLFKK